MRYLIYKMGKALSVLTLVGVSLTACEKNYDYTIPPEANTFQDDVNNSFKVLSEENKKWIWPVAIASNPFSNEGMGLIAEFRKDSTAYVRMIAKKTILAQFSALLATGKLDAFQRAVVNAYSGTFAGFADWNLRNLIFNNPANATFLVNTQAVMPNIVNFNPIVFGDVENGFSYNLNGPTQLSLTFTNTTVFPQLKQGRVLDYDFRVLSFSSEKVELDGYYSNSANRKSVLYGKPSDDVLLFAAGSNIFVREGNLLVGRSSIKVNGNTVALPTGETSGLDVFYRFYKQLFIAPAVAYGFTIMDKAAALPDALKASEYYVVKSAYSGNLSTVAAGTVLVSLAGYNASGVANGTVVDFIKD